MTNHSCLLTCIPGAGYHLAVVKEATCDVQAVTRVVQSHVTGARLESDVSAELSYILPQERKSHFSALFAELDQNKEALGIASYGASVTTMEEVFIR
jgi:ATP-binding cassette subfamily A (ABC1) protein 3